MLIGKNVAMTNIATNAIKWQYLDIGHGVLSGPGKWRRQGTNQATCRLSHPSMIITQITLRT